VGDPILESNITRRVDFPLFIVEALENDELVHEAPAIVGCSTPSALILMDYPNRQRLKIMARTTVIDADQDPELIERLRSPGYKARIERAVIFDVEAYDWNCPQHITPRYSAEEILEAEAEAEAAMP